MEKKKHTIIGTVINKKIYCDSFLVQKNRNIRIWLPKSYAEDKKPYEVIYMFDGANLFDEATAFVGEEWKIDETIENEEEKGIYPSIVVGIDSSRDRLSELLPSFSKKAIGNEGYKGDLFLLYLVEKVIPFVEENYNVVKSRDGRSIGGSSLGGLMALAAAISYEDVFSSLYCFSPAFPFFKYGYLEAPGGEDGTRNDEAFYYVIDKLTDAEHLSKFTIALCSGGNGIEKNYYRYIPKMKDCLINKGYEKKLLFSIQDKEEEHSEKQWARFFPYAYRFIKNKKEQG